jgi:HEAT repeat protein
MSNTRMARVRALTLSALVALTSVMAGGRSHLAAETPRVERHVLATTAPAPWAEADPADSLYKAAREALNRSDYRRAATLFDQITSRYPKSAYSGDAYYYRAFALYRAGGEANLRLASRALDEQHSRFPRAKTADDANELRVRIRGELAKRGDADAAAQVTSAASEAPACPKGSGERDNDESDIRTAALNALLQMDSESALPIIKQVLQKRDACSAAMRKKAVFLLSQKQTSETEATLIDVVRNDPSKDVRETAVFWLGQVHTDKAASMLEEIATSGADVDLRDKAIFALSQSNSPRATAFVRRIAENPDVPGSLRGKAIFQLGQHPSAENAEYLRTLYAKLGKDGRGDDLRRNLLFSLSQMRGFGNDKWLLSVAADGSQSEEVRKQALFAAGQAGVSGAEMASIYDRMTDRELKYQLIWVLSDTHDRAGSDKLVEIAQKDRDPEMRKKAIFWLGQKNDPRIRQILLDIITKP